MSLHYQIGDRVLWSRILDKLHHFAMVRLSLSLCVRVCVCCMEGGSVSL